MKKFCLPAACVLLIATAAGVAWLPLIDRVIINVIATVVVLPPLLWWIQYVLAVYTKTASDIALITHDAGKPLTAAPAQVVQSSQAAQPVEDTEATIAEPRWGVPVPAVPALSHEMLAAIVESGQQVFYVDKVQADATPHAQSVIADTAEQGTQDTALPASGAAEDLKKQRRQRQRAAKTAQKVYCSYCPETPGTPAVAAVKFGGRGKIEPVCKEHLAHYRERQPVEVLSIRQYKLWEEPAKPVDTRT